MKKFSNATMAAVTQHPQAIARLALVFVASLLVVLLALMGMSSGPGGALVFAQATESPTPTPPSTDPAIAFLNPVVDHDSGTIPGGETRPHISDFDDGTDQAYHLVAWTGNLPDNAVVEAYYTPFGISGVPLPETTIGTLDLVAGTTDTWEMFWDIPDEINDGPGLLTVRLFEGGLTGFEEVANHEVEVVMRHEDDDNPPNGDGEFAAETVELKWPSQFGELGFYKPRGGAWRAIVDATQSAFTSGSDMLYTKSAPGENPEWIYCGDLQASSQCTLVGKDVPSEVTAFGAMGYQTQDVCCIIFSEESSDAHRIRPYLQEPASIKMFALATTDAAGGTYRRVVAPDAQTGEPHQCLSGVVEIRDDRDRPVQGPNIDIHAAGPSDQLQYGDEDVMSAPGVTIEGGSSSGYKRPDKGSHTGEQGRNCDRRQENEGETYQEKPLEGDHGEHNRPSIDDEKHRESTLGAGLSGGSGTGFGRYNFHLWSPNVGLTDVTAWIDDQPLIAEETPREADTDTMDAGELTVSAQMQWLPAPMSITFDPVSDTAAAGSCNKYTVRVRSGTTVVPGINVDVHATGPSNELDFCDPGDGSPRRAPELRDEEHPHKSEDEGEARHDSTDAAQPQTQHTEGETDDLGNFVIGITSPVSGDTTLQGWVDGERGTDNDLMDAAEINATATNSWASSIEDAEVSFVNPSPYGIATPIVSNKQDADSSYHIVTRVDAVGVPGVEIFYTTDGSAFTKIGDAVQVAGSDTWELLWDVNVPDAAYTLRAQVTGTTRFKDQAITVNNAGTPTNPQDEPSETLELTRPLDAQTAPFTDRKTKVEGVVSNGTDGVDIFYTKVGSKDTPQSANWISCGFARPGADRRFTADCTLQGSDQAGQVTGIAAITYDCAEDQSGECDPTPP